MKAIDRAARWAAVLEGVGFDLESQTEEVFGHEYVTVRAQKHNSVVRFTVQMDTKYTRFVTGSVGYISIWRRANQPSKMASLVFGEAEMERYRMRQAVAS